MGSQKKKAIKFIKKGNLKHKIAKRNEKKRFNAKKDKKRAAEKSTPAKKNAPVTTKADENDEGDMLDDMDVDDFLNADFLDSDAEDNEQDDDVEQNDDDDNDDSDDDSDNDNDDDEDKEDEGESSEEEDESALDPRYMSAIPDEAIEEASDEEENAPQDEDRSRKELTMDKLKSIEKHCAEAKTIKALRPLLQIFSDACRSSDSTSKAPKNTPYDIRSSAVYNQLMVAVFKQTKVTWSAYCGAEGPVDAKKWGKISLMVRRFFACCVYLIEETTSEDIHRFVLRNFNAYLRFAAPCVKTSRKLLKCFVHIWGKSLDTHVCMLAFVRVRELATLVPFPFLETCLKALYVSYMRNVKFTNGVNFQHHIVMGNCMVELYGIDLVSSYQHVFVYIRQLAVMIRKAIAAPSAETLKGILTWRFVNCLKVWAAVVAAYPALKALVYPLTQLTLATIRLASTARYLPLKLQCIKVLQQISLSTNTFIPTTPVLIEILQSNYVTQKKRTVKETELVEVDLLVKLSKSALDSRRVRDMVVSKVFDLLQKECDIQKFSIAFPEFGVPLHLALSKFASTTPVPQWKKLAKGLCQQIETRSEWIRNKRMTSDIAPKDMSEIEAFLAQERKTAAAQMMEKEKKQQADKAAQYAKTTPIDEKSKGNNDGDDDDEEDEDDDEETEAAPLGSVDDEDQVEDMVWSDDE